MFNLFSKYLLIGISAMVLLAGAQNGLFNKQSAGFVLAEGESDLQRTMTSSGGECIDGRMHWVNRFSDGTADIDPTANEFCSGSGTNAQIIPDPNQAAPAQVQTAQVPVQPSEPARVDQCADPNTPDTQTCNNGIGTGHKYCTWTPSGNVWSDCRIESCNDGNRAAPTCVEVMVSPGSSSSNWQCERDIAAGRATCTDNTTFCEDTGASQSVIFLKRNGRCNPSLSAERDQNGCVFDQQQVAFQNFACGGQPSQPQQPQQPSAPQQPLTTQQSQSSPVIPQTCFVCDNTGFADGQGRWRVDGNGCPANPPMCQADNSATFAGCLGASVGAICETRPSPVCRSNGSCSVSTPAVCGQTATGVDNCGRFCSRSSVACVNPIITVNPAITNTNNNSNTNTNTSSNSNTNTITNNVTSREIVREVVAPTTFGNVGVGNSVVYTQPVQYSALPKTGLPEIVWSTLAFIPAGFGLRKFAKIKKALEDHPSFIWEDRQFKA